MEGSENRIVTENIEKTVRNRTVRGRQTRGRTVKNAPDRRRPTATVVRTLTSNALAEKYETLAEKKSIIADYTIKKLRTELLHAEEEHAIRKKCLELDLKIKQKEVEKL